MKVQPKDKPPLPERAHSPRARGFLARGVGPGRAGVAAGMRGGTRCGGSVWRRLGKRPGLACRSVV